MKLWEKTKNWFKCHKTGVKATLIGIGSFAGGLAVMHKIDCMTVDKALEMLPGEVDKELAKMSNDKETARTEQEYTDKTAWNKDWDAQALALEFATHQPLGPFREPGENTDEDGYVDPLEGNSYIVAGPNSYYNDNPDTVEIYVVDNDGWYHRKPDDVYNA